MVAVAERALNRTFAALAHPTRRAILSRLAREGAASVTDLAEPFDVSLMAVSKHLKVMEGAGLITRERDGRVHRCAYDPEAIGRARDWIAEHHAYWERQLDQLARYLERPGRSGHAPSDTEANQPDDPGEAP